MDQWVGSWSSHTHILILSILFWRAYPLSISVLLHLIRCFLCCGPLAAMEASSVYMCFPCYREFNTLEEVLEHQLTCTAEEEQPDTSGTTPITVPVLQTRGNAEQVGIGLLPVLLYGCQLEMNLKKTTTSNLNTETDIKVELQLIAWTDDSHIRV